MTDFNVGIIGAGVIGLTTALELKKEIPNAKVSIFADKFTTDTTSHVAAGVFRPGTSFCGPTEYLTRKWIYDSYHFWEDLWFSPEGPKAGVTQLSGYIFSSTNKSIVENHLIDKIVPLYREASEEELKLCPGNWKYGSFFTTVLTDCSLYLPWAMEKLRNNNVQFIDKHVENFFDLPEKCHVLINCAGLGAKKLCNDHKLVPIRGQVIKVDAPFIKTFFYGDYDTYIIPGFSGVTLGGCRQYDSYNLSPCKYDSAAIKERCLSLVPSLRSAKIIKECVGLRPHRDPVRLEKEILAMSNNQDRVKIVHNYGHGGYGVTTAPGTAKYAVQLLKEIWAGNSKL